MAEGDAEQDPQERMAQELKTIRQFLGWILILLVAFGFFVVVVYASGDGGPSLPVKLVEVDGGF